MFLRQLHTATAQTTQDRVVNLIERWSWILLLFSGISSGLVPLPALARKPLIQANAAVQSNSAESSLSPQSAHLADMEFRLWQRINEIRIQAGLQPLQANLKLIQLARSHSQTMMRQGCFSHQCSNQGTPRQRVEAAGMSVGQVAENLMLVFRDTDTVNQSLQTWMNSAAHQRNLLLPEVSETGIGIGCQQDNCYVTQIAAEPQPTSVPALNPFLSPEDFAAQFKQAESNQAVQLTEINQVQQFRQQLELPLSWPVTAAPVDWMPSKLRMLAQQSGQRAAVLYAVSLQDQLHLLLVLPGPQPLAQSQTGPTLLAAADPSQTLLAQAQTAQVIHRAIRPVKRADLLQTAEQLQLEVSDLRKTDTTSYMAPAQKLHQWLIAPLEPQLKAHRIDTLLFSMGDGLRSIPFATLHDGQQFLIQQYRMALIPSFGMTQAQPTKLHTQTMLAMGISESTQGLPRLPAVPLEISTLTDQLWQGRGKATLNEQSTLNNLKVYNRQQGHGIIHLATHAAFRPGQVNNSFIQFWNRKLTLGQLRDLSQELQWHTKPAVELLVLSACQTALGNKEAELGFAGIALKAGVQSTVASLWMINDEASLGLMTKFYDALRSATSKVEAMRQAQLAMINGELHIKDGQLQLSEQTQLPLPPELSSGGGDRAFRHPYFWSGYTLVGNWN